MNRVGSPQRNHTHIRAIGRESRQTIQGDPMTDRTPAAPEANLAPLYNRALTLVIIILPMVALVVGMIFLWNRGFDWLQLGLLIAMYMLTGLGITIGYHRLFTHKSFETNPVIKATLGILGSMAVEGPILGWCAHHRRHHQHSDRPDDPHSPHTHGEGLMNMMRGFWRAHIGWLFEQPANSTHYIKDLMQDRTVRVISRLFPLWAILSLFLPAIIAGLITWSWMGAFLGFIWGGLVRIMVVHHITWSINSVCHIWGSRPYRSHDESRNNVLFGILGFGEGWHNNHHAFPTSARHGLRWWQIDTSWIIIWFMSKIGLAWNVRVPTKDRMDAKRI